MGLIIVQFIAFISFEETVFIDSKIRPMELDNG
jgi:hypothetical protein